MNYNALSPAKNFPSPTPVTLNRVTLLPHLLANRSPYSQFSLDANRAPITRPRLRKSTNGPLP